MTPGRLVQHLVRSAGAAMVAIVLALGTGCNGFFVYPGSTSTGSTTSGGDYVYVANQTTGTVAAYSVGSGALTSISGSPYALGFSPTALAINPANTIVFVAGATAGAGYIASYSIASDGSLTLLTNNSVGLADPVSMDVSPDGQWLIGLDGNGLTVDEYQIAASNGALTLATGQTYVISGATVVPRALRISPNANYVFAAIGTAGDLVFPFNTTSGVLSSPGRLTLPVNVSDNALAVAPGGNTLYIARSGTSGGLAPYSVSSAGVLQSLVTTPYAAGSQPFAVAVNSDGTGVYIANAAGFQHLRLHHREQRYSYDHQRFPVCERVRPIRTGDRQGRQVLARHFARWLAGFDPLQLRRHGHRQARLRLLDEHRDGPHRCDRHSRNPLSRANRMRKPTSRSRCGLPWLAVRLGLSHGCDVAADSYRVEASLVILRCDYGVGGVRVQQHCDHLLEGPRERKPGRRIRGR